MEGFSPAWAWAVIGLLLALAELLTGAFVLLALGIAALITALAAALFDLSLSGQLIVMGLSAGLLVPLVIYKIRPMFSPKGVKYGTTGTGAETGKQYRVETMTFDSSINAIKVNGDLYRIQAVDDRDNPSETTIRPGDRVTLMRFDGTLALVRPTD